MLKKSAERRTKKEPGRNVVAGGYRLAPLEQQVSDDSDWAQTAPEVQKYRGKFAAVRRKKVIAAGNDRHAVIAKAAKRERCLADELAIVVVPPGGDWEIPY